MPKIPDQSNNSWIEISKKALIDNIATFVGVKNSKAEIMCVVKANAYGHGLLEVVKILKNNPQVDWFAVFDFNDALAIRGLSQKNILVLCNTLPSHWNMAIKHNISVTISTVSELTSLSVYAHRTKLKYHLKIDTGLNRQGFQLEVLNKVINICKNNNIAPDGLYSHFSGVEFETFNRYSNKQYKILQEWKTRFNTINMWPKVHISGTAGYFRDEKYKLDIVRLGIGMYGLWPSSEIMKIAFQKFPIKPILSWKTTVLEIKKIKKGAMVGYDCTYKAKSTMLIAILPVGYYDGLPRALSNKGLVLIKGEYAPIIGRIMMNMCIVDISKIKHVSHGDIVTLIGGQGNRNISTDMLSNLAGTINYEFVTRLNERIKRTIT
jgi:alanine racemase